MASPAEDPLVGVALLASAIVLIPVVTLLRMLCPRLVDGAFGRPLLPTRTPPPRPRLGRWWWGSPAPAAPGAAA